MLDILIYWFRWVLMDYVTVTHSVTSETDSRGVRHVRGNLQFDTKEIEVYNLEALAGLEKLIDKHVARAKEHIAALRVDMEREICRGNHCHDKDFHVHVKS